MFGSVSYLDARKKVLCLDLGGSGSYYIDGTDIDAEGTFKWATFEKTFLHENFAVGQPDGGATDDCLTMAFSSGEWDDVDCATQLKSVCEFEGRYWLLDSHDITRSLRIFCFKYFQCCSISLFF